ncbi:MAG TPA: ATPase [Candidatus Blautia merdigallinarum]|uniref:ATPase n=1 Tax=Candidatus Blautia merdigallinarum TaxID=2838495 RepID=A0A9D2N2V8_9FIRM|nr:ATPase [Candidatus Blautia merdigallinarum]
MSSRIEQIIEEIEEYVESCKYQPLSTTKIIVNKEEIEELLRELRLKTPDEIKRYQKIISNKDAILADAQAKADNIIEDTKKQVQEMVKESEVMQQAYAQANETINSANQQAQAIIDAATNDANALRLSAVSYTDELMGNMGQIASSMLENAAGKYNEFVQALQASLDVIRQNRAELAPQLQGAASVQTAAPAQEPAQEDYQEEEPVEYEDDDEYDDEYDDLDDDFDDFDE